MRERFEAEVPEGLFLDAGRPAELSRWMRERAWIDRDDEVTTVAVAGKGNMNLTLRVTLSSGRSLIVKQSRAWVERYPQFDAPMDRALVEARFYQAARADDEVAALMPRLLGVDETSRILALQDLGPGADMMSLYRADLFYDWEEVQGLLRWLGRLHRMPVVPDPLLRNRGMRALNHAHIFHIPLDPDNGLDLAVGDALKRDDVYVAAVHALGELYLSDGPALLHGDFYPGSFLRTDAGVRVIDPEFCFLGRPEFDVGVFVAHWLLSDHAEADVARVFGMYSGADGFNEGLARQFAGVEIMRRILGVAQLPIDRDAARLERLLATSKRMVLP